MEKAKLGSRYCAANYIVNRSILLSLVNMAVFKLVQNQVTSCWHTLQQVYMQMYTWLPHKQVQMWQWY